MGEHTGQSKRLFYALWPDDATRTALMALQAHVQGRKTAYQNLHLTLAFLGQQPASLLPALTTILARLPSMPLQLTLDRVGYFTQKRIAWAGMHAVPEGLLALQRALVQELQQHCIAWDGRVGFRPHVTLARDAASLADFAFDPIAWRADHVALVESVTNPEGAVYRVLASGRRGAE